MSYQRPAFWRIPKNKPEPVNVFSKDEGHKVSYNYLICDVVYW